MAVDTAIKRASVIGVGSPIPRLLPIPSGTVGAGPRQMLAYLYIGILAGTAAVGEIIDFTLYLLKTASWTGTITRLQAFTATIEKLIAFPVVRD